MAGNWLRLWWRGRGGHRFEAMGWRSLVLSLLRLTLVSSETQRMSDRRSADIR